MVATTKVATIGMLKVQLQNTHLIVATYVTRFNCLPVCMSEIAKETYSGPAM